MSRASLILLCLMFSACGGGGVSALKGADVLDWDTIRPYSQTETLNESKGAGLLSSWSSRRVALKKRNYQCLSIVPKGDYSKLELYCEAFGSVGDRKLDAKALVATPGAGVEAELMASGLKRTELFLIEPKSRVVVYKTQGADRVYLGYRRSGERAELVAVARTSAGVPVDPLFPGSVRWSSIQKRVARAIKTGATLDQVREEVAFASAVPFADDRKESMKAFQSFSKEIEKRAKALKTAWPKAALAERCDLSRRATALGQAARDLSRDDIQAMASGFRKELLGQLKTKIESCQRAQMKFSEAAWVLARHSVDSSAENKAALTQLESLQTEMVPALSGSVPSSVNELYGNRRIFGERALMPVLGVRLVSSDSFARRCKSPAKLERGAMKDSLKSQVKTVVVPHNYTVPNPAHAVWQAKVNEAQRRLSQAKSTRDATANYDKVVKDKTTYMNRDGSNKRVSEINRIVRNEAMYQSHLQAKAEISAMQQVLSRLAAVEPPRRLKRSTTYVVEHQLWTGQSSRAVRCALDGRPIVIAQSSQAPATRLKTKGFQGSDLAHENVPATNSWTTRESLVKTAQGAFDEALGAKLKPHLQACLKSRLERWIASKKSSAQAEERFWAHIFLGLPVSKEDSKRSAQALNMER